MAFLSEAQLETALLEQMVTLGYACASDEFIGPDGKQPERKSHDEVVLKKRFEDAVARLNPGLPLEARQDAIRKVTQSELPNLLEENRRIHYLLTEGVAVEYRDHDGTVKSGIVRLIDFDRPENNDWLAVRQFMVIEGERQRRADVVLFVNGLPLAVIELKAPGGENATLDGAFNQLQTYKREIPALFRSNAVLVISNGIAARIGSLSADYERFMPWRTTDGTTIAPKGQPELATLIEGVFEHGRFLELLRYFTVFARRGDGLSKIIAGYHQFHAAKKAVSSTLRASFAGVAEDPTPYGLPSVASQPRGDHKAGVIWHTQGSGKSLLMVFYSGLLIQQPAMANPTLVVITDRSDLDDQLFETFAMCQDLLRQTPVQAQDRDHLRALLNRDSGGIIFTTMQKFMPFEDEVDFPCLTRRSNVVVIADEAHRSQYGFAAKMQTKSGEISYGFAKYLRDALPNASFIGFTGTPIEASDINTPAVFGHYIDIYDISRAVEDGATVPIYYESRLARIALDESERPKIDEDVEALLEDADETSAERMKQKWASIEALVGSQKRLALIAEDIVQHFENRLQGINGKGMIVCMSRRICVDLYAQMIKLRPDWHNEDDNQGVIKVVMTGSAADPAEWQAHIRNKARRELLARRLRNPNDPLKLVIVCDMWLTGLDAPCLHTLYIDKPMRGHNLMQAIARVNRVFRDKQAGLVVDYIGIAQNLKAALAQYAPHDREQTGIDEGQAVAALMERLEIVRAMFHGFDYQKALRAEPQERLATLAAAIEWILTQQQAWAALERTPEGKKSALRRFDHAVLALSRAFALAASSDLAKVVREEVGFFQAVRVALAKSGDGAMANPMAQDWAVRQIVSRAVVSTEIIDILKAAGIQTPDISILSDDFLAEVQSLPQKNLALEALRKLLRDEIRARGKTHVVQSRAFSERLEKAIARYHANAITTTEVLQELIAMARDIRDMRAQGREQGLSDEEIAFYDALAENQSAVEVMGDEKLRVIAHELLSSLRQNISVDWARRESARAKLRVLVKRVLRKYGYPPDLQDKAVQTVLQQAESLSFIWSAGFEQ